MLTGDGVGIIYMNHFRAAPEAATFYTVGFILLGRLVILNLFLAILLDNFQQDSLTKEIINKEHNEGGKTGFKQVIRNLINKCLRRGKATQVKVESE
jgi:hypothetical protein